MITFRSATSGEIAFPESAERYNAINRILSTVGPVAGDPVLRASVTPGTIIVNGICPDGIDEYSPVWIIGVAPDDSAVIEDNYHSVIDTVFIVGDQVESGVEPLAWGITQADIPAGTVGPVLIAGISRLHPAVTARRLTVKNINGKINLSPDVGGEVVVINSAFYSLVCVHGIREKQYRACPAIVRAYQNDKVGVDLYANGFGASVTGTAILTLVDGGVNTLPPIGAKIVAHPFFTEQVNGEYS